MACCERWRWLRAARPDLGPWIDLTLAAQDVLRAAFEENPRAVASDPGMRDDLPPHARDRSSQ
jgi:hypothetical protein